MKDSLRSFTPHKIFDFVGPRVPEKLKIFLGGFHNYTLALARLKATIPITVQLG
jgi:hypothetical protein